MKGSPMSRSRLATIATAAAAAALLTLTACGGGGKQGGLDQEAAAGSVRGVHGCSLATDGFRWLAAVYASAVNGTLIQVKATAPGPIG